MKTGIILHDLHLEFCQHQAKSEMLESKWHEALLDGYLELTSAALCRYPFALSSQHLVEFALRSWWTVADPDDGYINSQLARHLSSCGRGSELAAVLLDARWVIARGKHGGLLGLKADFEVLDELLRADGRTGENVHIGDIGAGYWSILKAIQLSWESFFDGLRETGENTGENVCSQGMRKSFQLIAKAVQVSWGRFFDGKRAFQFQMCGRCRV